LNLYRFD